MTLDEFIESVKEAFPPDETPYTRAELAEHGCEGTAEYYSCVCISEDYERVVREHGVMLATIEAAQHRGRYLEDAYQDAVKEAR